MLLSVWSLKGGSGCSVVTALLGLRLGPTHGPLLLLDLADDLGVVLGIDAARGPTLADLLRLGVDLDHTALAEVGATVGPGIVVLRAGQLGDHAEKAINAMGDAGVDCIVDVGCILDGGSVGAAFARASSPSLLVTRACYLSLRRVPRSPVEPTGVVVVAESGRAFDTGDVERATGAPVVASVACDPAIARAVDAGLLAGRIPRGVLGAFGDIR